MSESVWTILKSKWAETKGTKMRRDFYIVLFCDFIFGGLGFRYEKYSFHFFVIMWLISVLWQVRHLGKNMTEDEN